MINFIDQKKPISTEGKYYRYNAFIRSRKIRIDSYYFIIQLSRNPYSLPELWINPKIKDIDAFTMKDFRLINYESHKTIKGKMSV